MPEAQVCFQELPYAWLGSISVCQCTSQLGQPQAVKLCGAVAEHAVAFADAQIEKGFCAGEGRAAEVADGAAVPVAGHREGFYFAVWFAVF